MEDKGSNHLLSEEILHLQFTLFSFLIEIKHGSGILCMSSQASFTYGDSRIGIHQKTPSLQLDTRGQNDTTLRMSNRVKL